jgi:hypothetical protein
MPQLRDFIGESIVILCLPVDEDRPTVVKLLDVDDGGIWIEAQQLTERFLRDIGQQATLRSPVYFVPYAKISWIARFAGGPALSESSFGLPEP